MSENIEKSGEDGLIAKLQTFPYCAMVVGAYVVALAIFSFLVVRLGLRDSWLYLFMAPSVLAAFYFRRRLYLSMQGALVVAAIWVTSLVSSDFSASLTTIVLSTISNLVMSEAINALVEARERTQKVLERQSEETRWLAEMGTALIDCEQADEVFDQLGQFLERVTSDEVTIVNQATPDQQALITRYK